MARRKHRNGSGTYAAYVFTDKDPEIARVRELSHKAYGHDVKGSDLSRIRKDGGPSQACMRAWFFGETKRPRNDTLEAAGRALGFHRVWQPLRRKS